MTMTETSLDYTGPENRGICGFCGGEEGGYAKQDPSGTWKAACWKCVKPANAGAPQPKREQVGTVFTEDLDAEENQTKKKKAKGMAPSGHRPKVF
jgi:hypothetical protein